MTYLQNKGVISGFEDGTLRPDKTVSRAEAAIMIAKLKGLDGTQRDTGFKDVPKSLKASGYIAAAAKAGYVSGYENGTFKPDAPITRGDMAIILSRVFPLDPLGDIEFKDVSTNMKAYVAIGGVVSDNIATGYPDKTFRPTNATTRAQFSAFLSRGLEPKFQNDTHMAHSYLRDKTKSYTFSYADGKTATTSYVKPKGSLAETHNFLWTDKPVNGELTYYSEKETSKYYFTGSSESSFSIDLIYPIKKGMAFDEVEGFDSIPSVITNTGVTVKTKYKTFSNAVEVTVKSPKEYQLGEDHKYYMIEGFGRVKTVSLDGKVLSELISVK